MRKLLLTTTALLVLSALPAKATIIEDPLHLFCSNCSADNGTFTPSNGTPTGITVNETGTVGSITGDFLLKILVPTDSTTVPNLLQSIGISGTVGANAFSGSATLFTSAGSQGTVWSTGFLETDFLGLTLAQGGAPPNPIGAFLPSSQTLDANALGFTVLTLDLGTLTVPQQNKGTSPFSLDLATSIPGLWVLGDVILPNGGGDITTAQSAALFDTGGHTPAVPEPSTWAMLLIGFLGVAGMAGRKSWAGFRLA